MTSHVGGPFFLKPGAECFHCRHLAVLKRDVLSEGWNRTVFKSDF